MFTEATPLIAVGNEWDGNSDPLGIVNSRPGSKPGRKTGRGLMWARGGCEVAQALQFTVFVAVRGNRGSDSGPLPDGEPCHCAAWSRQKGLWSGKVSPSSTESLVARLETPTVRKGGTSYLGVEKWQNN